MPHFKKYISKRLHELANKFWIIEEYHHYEVVDSAISEGNKLESSIIYETVTSGPKSVSKGNNKEEILDLSIIASLKAVKNDTEPIVNDNEIFAKSKTEKIESTPISKGNNKEEVLDLSIIASSKAVKNNTESIINDNEIFAKSKIIKSNSVPNSKDNNNEISDLSINCETAKSGSMPNIKVQLEHLDSYSMKPEDVIRLYDRLTGIIEWILMTKNLLIDFHIDMGSTIINSTEASEVSNNLLGNQREQVENLTTAD